MVPHVEMCALLVRECTYDDEMISIKVDLDGISLDQGKFKQIKSRHMETSRSGLKRNTFLM